MSAIPSYSPPIENQVQTSISVYSLVGMRALGVVLIAAAILKVLSPFDVTKIGIRYDLPTWLLVIGVQAELLVGGLLILGIWPQISWRAAVSLFAVFTGFSFYRGIAGYESCGCFGSMELNPWWMFVIDLTVLSGLIIWRNIIAHTKCISFISSRLQFAIAGYIALSCMSAAIMLWPSPSNLASQAGIIRSGDLTILEPEEWLGQKLPILDDLIVNSSADLSTGDWILVLYHHDCPSCQAALPRYARLVDADDDHASDNQIAFVEIPPYGNVATAFPSPIDHVRLADDREWFVQTPLEIRLKDGEVERVSRAMEP